MPTEYVCLFSSGGLAHSHPGKNRKEIDQNRRLWRIESNALPRSWRPHISDDGSFDVIIPYRSKKELGTKIGRFMRTLDHNYEGSLSAEWSLYKFKPRLENRKRGNLGSTIAEGSGFDLLQAIGFWTGIDWTSLPLIDRSNIDDEAASEYAKMVFE